MNAIAQLNDEQKWPSVDLAYDFVLPSYQLLMARFEAADNRLTALLTLASSVTLGVPLFAKTAVPSASFESPWFIGGLCFFVCGAVFGVVGRATGSVTLPNPAVLYRENLHKPLWIFKKDQIFRAGQHFAANKEAIARKGTFALILTLAMLFEVVMFVRWLAV